MQRFDAIVVGAGPAGSSTAYRLARAGARVLMLDRARFPRDKPCGGGLTARALRELPIDPAPVVEDSVDRFELRLAYRSRIERRSPFPLVLMTQRRRLDAYLAEQAAEAGAEFRQGVRVTEIDPAGIVSADGERVEADVIVGADGVNGVSARTLGLADGRRYGVAYEGNASYEAIPRARFRGRAVLELGAVAGGYGWVFPKGDHVNVGVGGWEQEGPRLREELRRLCDLHRVDERELVDLRGYRLPMRRPGDRVVEGRALLVGDAAGLVDPLSGDGIYEAALSARLAAGTTLELLAGRAGDLEPYQRDLDTALNRLEASAWKAKLALDRFPRFTFAVIRLPIVWRFFEGFVRGDVKSPGDARGLVRAPLRLVEALGKPA
ncbi:MAG: geranylgeranyl reductase family protein [Gaiellaceae bacterium]